jgi:hypothetical protein
MDRARIVGVVLSGHKDAAIEVPFDPAKRFGLEPGALRPGRRGHRVRVLRGRARFETEIVPRSKRFWLVLPEAALSALRATEGDRVELLLEPIASAGPQRGRVSRPRAAPRSSSRAARRGG